MFASVPFSCSPFNCRSATPPPPLRRALCHARRALQYFLQPPALQFRKRPSGSDLYRVAYLRFPGLIVRVVFLGVAHYPVIERVLHRARHLHHNRLLHLRRSHDPRQFLPDSALRRALLRRCSNCFVCHYAFLNSVSRSTVLIRAKSRFASRSFFKPSPCPVESGKDSRKIATASPPCWVSSPALLISRSFLLRPAFRSAITVPPPG